MGLSVERPYLLILIPMLVFGVILAAKWLNKTNIKRMKYKTVLRSVVLSLLILSLCGLSLTWKLDETATIFLIDKSDSSRLITSDMEEFVKEAYKFKGTKDKLGVVSFGDNAQVETFIGNETGFNELEGNVNSSYTNIENAIGTAISLFPSNSNKRVVLLSDGEENTGNSSKIALSLMEQGIDFKYHKYEKVIKDEALVDRIELPEKLSLDEEFNIVVTIDSTTAQKSKLTLLSERTKLSEDTVELQKGTNKFVFRDKAITGGFKSYNVIIDPEKDDELKNNEAASFTNILAKPKILVIEDTKGESDEIVKILKASSMDFRLVNAKAAPGSLNDLNLYKTVITCNVLLDNLNKGFVSSLESYVKDFGGGFIATGGDNSFALGGYTKTPLEKVLPVYMDMRGKKETPKMAMILIIDKSGSMTEGVAGISKVDMAKEGAIRSLDSLRNGKDEIGVLSLDGAYSWVVKRQIIKNRASIEDDIASIRADGGTSILPSLEAAYDSLKKSDAKIKHIILLTDGLAERTGYDELLGNMNKQKITVSTVAVGQDSDKELLSSISSACNGRFYVTDEYSNIPSIFTKETFMAARIYLNNREFTPVLNYSHKIIDGVAESGLPSLLGYVGASQKETSRVILQSDEEDPILTVWQYGLGKTVAWNSDVSGNWNANYIPWEKNLRLWQNIFDFTVANYENENASIEVIPQGKKAVVALKNKDIDTKLESKATVITPSGESIETVLNPVAPGQYEGTIDLKENGVYMVSGKQLKNGETVNAVNTGYAAQYSPEYRLNNASKLDKLVVDVGGRMISLPKDVFTGGFEDKWGQRELTSFLISLFLLLFMLDIASRRLRLNTNKFWAIWERVKGRARTGFAKFERKFDSKGINSYQGIDEIVEEVDVIEEVTGKVEPEKLSANALDTSQLLSKKKFKK